MPSFDPADYVQVNERLEKFRADHPTWGLVSELIHFDDKTFIVRAVVTDDEGRMIGTGLAEEVRGSSPVNKTSPLENCETSAWGRALANLAYDVRRSIASREEMEKTARSPGKPAPVRRARGAGKAGEAETPAPPPRPPADLEQRRAELWSKVNGLSAAEKGALRVWLGEQKITDDFSAHTAEEIDRIEAELVESYSDPFDRS